MPVLIGIMGNAGVGKDTFANHLVNKYGFVKISLADEMKRICRRVYDFSDEQLWGPSEMRNKPDERYLRRLVTTDEREVNGGWSVTRTHEYLSPRVALQLLGTEWGRACYQNTWVDLTIRDAKKLMNTNEYAYNPHEGLVRSIGESASVVIPDVRFENEIDAIQGAGGIVIRLKRKTQTDALKVGVQGHSSEAEQMSIPDSAVDFVFESPNGLEALYGAIDNFVDANELDL